MPYKIYPLDKTIKKGDKVFLMGSDFSKKYGYGPHIAEEVYDWAVLVPVGENGMHFQNQVVRAWGKYECPTCGHKGYNFAQEEEETICGKCIVERAESVYMNWLGLSPYGH